MDEQQETERRRDWFALDCAAAAGSAFSLPLVVLWGVVGAVLAVAVLVGFAVYDWRRS